MKIISLFISLAILCINCKTTSYTPDNYSGAKLIIGTGGGFSGQLVEYCLLDNGQLFRRYNQEAYSVELESIDKKICHQLFENYHQLQFGDLKIDEPGNIYHYLILKEDDKSHKIQWGGYVPDMPKELTIYFANLKKLFTQQKEIRLPNQ